MADQSNASIRPPKDWQDFERKARVLFVHHLNDPLTVNNGRAGQAQHGVDVYGCRGGDPNKMVGIQCKGRDANFAEPISEKELRDEVEKSDLFEPSLSEFILITTAPDDAKIQAVARKITKERFDAGKLLRVDVWGWGRLEAEIVRYVETLRLFDPDRTLTTDAILQGIGEINAKADASSEDLSQIKAAISHVQQSMQRPQGLEKYSNPETLADPILNAELDTYRDYLKSGESKIALDLLEKFKSKHWEESSPWIKFRIVSNMASALADQGREAEAASLFFEAVTYQPDLPLAQANVALGHLLKKEVSEAKAAALSALQKNSDNAEAVSYLIQASQNDEAFDPLEVIPASLEDNKVVLAGLAFVYRAQNDPRWLDVAQKLEAQSEGDPILERTIADAELEKALSVPGALLGQAPTYKHDIESLKKAAQTLQKLWDKALANNRAHNDPSLPANLFQIYRFLDENNLADQVIQKARELLPQSRDIAKLSSMAFMKAGRQSDAISALEPFKGDPECLMLLSVLQLSLNPKQVIKDLEPFTNDGAKIQDRNAVMELLVDAYVSDNQASKALQLAEAEVRASPKDPGSYLTLAGALQAIGEKEKYAKTLDAALSQVNEETPFNIRILLANRFEDADRPEAVVKLLVGRIDTTRDSRGLVMLLSGLINSDDRKAANDLLKNLPEEISNQPKYLRAAVILHQKRKQYADAFNAAEKYLASCPSKLTPLLYWLDIALRHGKTDEILKKLESINLDLQGSPEQFTRLARFMDKFGQHTTGLALAYKQLLLHPKNLEVQQDYIALMLQAASPEKVVLEAGSVALNTKFSVKNAVGESQTFIIEPDDTLRVTEFYIHPEHPIAKLALGKKVGEKFALDPIATGPELEITSIKHKYLHALHEKMGGFEYAFPTQKVLKRFVAERENVAQPIIQAAEARNRNNMLALETYRDNPLPLEFFAECLGTDIIAIWGGLQSTGHFLKVAVGNAPERKAAFNAIRANNKAGCILDALTLFVVYQLGISDIVEAICGAIHTTESAKDVFHNRHEETTAHGPKPYATVFHVNGQNYLHEVTSEQIAEEVKKSEEILHWLKTIPIIAAESSFELSTETHYIKDNVSPTFLDPILAAKESQKLLVCEDLIYRQFAASAAQLNAVWLQPILMAARDTRVITQERYAESIYTLALYAHTALSMDTTILKHGMREDEKWEPKFRQLIKALFGKNADLESHYNVMANFIAQIWNGAGSSLKVKQAVSMLFERYFFGEWNATAYGYDIAMKVKRLKHVFSKFDLPFQMHLDAWLVGNFIVKAD